MKFEQYLSTTNFKMKRPLLQHWNGNQFHKQIPQKQHYTINKMTDSEGLRRAYAQGDYHVHGDTLYVAGSHTLKDFYDDLTKIPFYGDVRNSARYKKAQEGLLNNPQVHNGVGHSLGGSVALELEKRYDHIKSSRTYGAPVFDPLGKESNDVSRYRNWSDLVSVADRSAVKSVKMNPFSSFSLTHAYSNLAEQFTSEEKVLTNENDIRK
jgi:hypothetical protein